MAEMEKNNNDDDNSLETLNATAFSENLIIDLILPRLPVKTLVRFKSVSKFWYSAISSPQFAKFHLKFSIHKFIILADYPPIRLLLSYDEHNNLNDSEKLGFSLELCFTKQIHQELHQILQFQPEITPSGVVEFVGTCNGLVCLYFRYFDLVKDKTLASFAVCNPALHEHSEIPNPDGSREELVALAYWFGYVSSVDDYKIVAKFVLFNGDAERETFEFHVFSFKSWGWSRIYDLERVCTTFDRLTREVMVVNDVLYWTPLLTSTDRLRPKRKIVGLNLAYDQVKEFSWMEWLFEYINVDFFVINECLTIICSTLNHYDIWSLKDPNNWGSWEKLFCTSSNQLGSMRIVNVTCTGKFLGRSYLPERFKIIDLSKNINVEPQREVYFPGNLVLLGTGDYVESLISPIGLGKSTKKEDHEV
ncbi:F-box protein At5g18160-like [Amaranthus tricolor]|uniref:F-box protein At5g18160-like n=1 Tax=Amaranthus tricolor TaxID=29722 RepID=UPI00258B1698|nr:F-box protein At5g18160-like [Amaranthus tricolor]